MRQLWRHVRSAKRLAGSLVVVGLLLASSIAVWGALVLVMGNGQPFMIVASNSMVPTIQEGDLVLVAGLDSSKISLGTVIVYQKLGSPVRVIHRVVCIATSAATVCTPPWYPTEDCFIPPCYFTKGDNNPAPDFRAILADELVGIWTGYKIPYLGMTLVCLRQDPLCPDFWRLTSVSALTGAVLSGIVFEYWLSWKSGRVNRVGDQNPENREEIL